MLPDFLGIGCLKCGTTWLHDLLDSHPDVYVPNKRKEVRFFDVNYDKGVAWYESFFPAGDEPTAYAAVGEITPHYMFHEPVPARIVELGTVNKVIAMFRDPVDRAYSHYRWVLQMQNYEGSMRQFLKDRPNGEKFGMYATHLENVLDHFDRSQLLVLIFEHVFDDVESAKQQIAAFLGVEPGRFVAGAGGQVVNKGSIPKFRGAYHLAGRVAKKLRSRGLHGPVNLARRVGMGKLFGKGDAAEPMDEQTAAYLTQLYEPQVRHLRELLETDLECWRRWK